MEISKWPTGICILVSFLMLAFGGCAVEPSRYVFYVSPCGNDADSGMHPHRPFATLGRARDAIRELKQKKAPLDRPATVMLRGGEYPLAESVVFTPADSGTAACPITYSSYPGDKVIISGGRRITGWKKFNDRLWQAHLPGVKAGQWRFRRLFVNGQERPRSRIPHEGLLTVAGFPDGGPEVYFITPGQRFEYAPGDIDPQWSNLEDGEIMVFHYWVDEHLPIKAVDPDQHIVTFRTKSALRFTSSDKKKGARYIIENIYEGLNRPGQWYLNRKTGMLTYWPMPDENPRQLEFTAPRVGSFLDFQGDPIQQQFVEHLHFDNLSFAYSHWDLADGDINSVQAAEKVPGAIFMRGARHCRFNHCRILGAGGYAFQLNQGCTHNHFTYNEIAYPAAGGFHVSGGIETQHPLLRTGWNRIEDNEIHHYGCVFKSAVGVLVKLSEGNRISHNHIHHGFYTGVSVGWSWGYQRTISRDNVIDYNHIHHIDQGLLSDMGAIYTLGVSPGTILRNNLIHDVDAYKYGGWGIYHDEGSSHILDENNIVYNTKYSTFNIHYSKEITVRNNIFAFGKLQQLSRGRNEPHQSVFFENNIVYWTEGPLLDKHWQDKPYEFYCNPFKKGRQTMEKTFAMDWNLYYHPNLRLNEVKFNKGTLAEWRQRGYDIHSIYADPLFVDPDNYDFRLQPNSPAFQLGFRTIDMTTVGPRGIPGPGDI